MNCVVVRLHFIGPVSLFQRTQVVVEVEVTDSMITMIVLLVIGVEGVTLTGALLPLKTEGGTEETTTRETDMVVEIEAMIEEGMCVCVCVSVILCSLVSAFV